MDSTTEQGLRQLVRQRLKKQVPEIERSLRQIAAGNPLGSEPRIERSVARITTKANLPKRDAEAFATVVRQKAALIESGARSLDGAEALQGPTIDFVGVEFLSRGRLAANTVGRVVFRSGRSQGSGFLVAPGLFLTNNHVIGSEVAARQMVVEFDYETDDAGGQRPVTAFEFDPAACFVADPVERLDFTLIAIGPLVAGAKSIASFGYLPLSDAPDKHMLGEIANIIQHPQGRPKEVVVRENNLISREETAQVLHYLADTEKGSSGSPVCNNDWEPIALHHWGEPALELMDILGHPLRSDVNEGVRISAIVNSLRARVPSLTGPNANVVAASLRLWNASLRPGPVGPSRGAGAADVTVARTESARPSASCVSQRASSDGTVTWTLPIEFSVKLPWASQVAPQPARPAPQAPSAPGRHRQAELEHSRIVAGLLRPKRLRARFHLRPAGATAGLVWRALPSGREPARAAGRRPARAALPPLLYRDERRAKAGGLHGVQYRWAAHGRRQSRRQDDQDQPVPEGPGRRVAGGCRGVGRLQPGPTHP